MIKLGSRPQKYASVVFLLCVICYTLYIIWTKTAVYCLNSDTVNEILYRYTCWSEKTLFPKTFLCSNESFTSRPVILYGILYAITNSFIDAFLIENCITFLLLNIIVFALLRLFISNISICFFATAWFDIFLANGAKEVIFFPMNAYLLFTIVILLTLIVRIRIYQKIVKATRINEGLSYKWLFISIFVMAALSGLVSIKMLLVLYIPLLIYDILKVITLFFEGKSIVVSRLIMLVSSIISCIINLLFQIIFLLFWGDTIVKMQISIAPISMWFDWNVISAQLQVLLHYFGIESTASLSSIEGIRMLIQMILFFMNILLFGWYLKRIKQASDDPVVELFGYWCCATLIIFLFQIITATSSQVYRYYFATGVLWPILAMISITTSCKMQSSKIAKLTVKGIVVAISVTMFFVSICIDNKTYQKENVPSIASVAQYVEEEGYEYVTGTYWNSDVLVGYSNGALKTQHTMDLKDLTPFYWITETTKLDDPRLGEPNILLLTDEEEQQAIENNGALARILNYKAEKIKEISEYNLYKLNENPLTMAKKIVEYEYILSFLGTKHFYDISMYNYGNGSFDADGNFITDGTEGFATWGPYCAVPEGKYRFILNYEVVENVNGLEQVGEFDLAIDTQRVEMASLSADAQSATLEMDFSEDQSTSSLEYRCYVMNGVKLKLISVEIEKVSP